MTTVMTAQEVRTKLSPPSPPWLRSRIAVKPAQAADTPAILAMLSRCSTTTLFHRFHGPSDGIVYTRALLARRSIDETLVAWHDDACVGLATLSPDGEGASHLGVLVEDAWQRQGVGRQLVSILLGQARAKGVRNVHADVLGDNRFIVEALRRAGSMTVAIASGTYSVDIDLD
jgi:N-acetylglutamate synthase-like GNAT family acetyltransferase